MLQHAVSSRSGRRQLEFNLDAEPTGPLPLISMLNICYTHDVSCSLMFHADERPDHQPSTLKFGGGGGGQVIMCCNVTLKGKMDSIFQRKQTRVRDAAVGSKIPPSVGS